MNAAFITIGNAGIDQALLGEVTVTQELNQHWWCEVRLRQSEDLRYPAESMLGRPLRVTTYDDAGAENEVFSGIIVESELEYEIYGSYGAYLKAVTRSWLLDLTPGRRYFPQQTGSAVAQQLVASAGLALAGSLPAPGARSYHQLDETPFRFLLRLVDDAECWLRPTATGIEVQSKFQNAVPIEWRQEGGLLSFAVEGGLSQPSCNGAHYDRSAMQSEVFEKVSDRTVFYGSSARMVEAAQGRSAALLPNGYVHQRSRAVTVSDFAALLKKESRRSQGRGTIAEGESLEPKVKAGNAVEITGPLDANGSYGVVRVVHRWTKTGYVNRFVCTPWERYTNPEPPALKKFEGIVPGRVVDNNDPKNRGRVRVQFYWEEENQTRWLASMTPHAGADRGFLFLPEIGDEVWVAFEEGDPERPQILGTAWNGVNKPPREDFWGEDVAPNNVKRIVTKSGHRISLVDQPGKSSLVLATPNHVKVALHENSNETGDSMLVLHSDGDICLSAPNGRIHCHSKYFSREVG